MKGIYANKNLFFIRGNSLSDMKRRGPGRPPKDQESYTPVSFRMPCAQAEYLLFLGRKFGWGCEINDVVRAVLVSEVKRLQEAGFHDKIMPISN
jgi:hypothetical protein